MIAEADIQHIIDVRRDAMASADRLSAILDALGVDVKDTEAGTTWVRRNYQEIDPSASSIFKNVTVTNQPLVEIKIG